MPFSIAGNISRFENHSIKKFEKYFGIILSEKQFAKQQAQLIQTSLKNSSGAIKILNGFSKPELISLIFLLTQFGDVILAEAPPDYVHFGNIPFAIEWTAGHCMVPLEILEFLSFEKIFRDQNYLFSLIPMLSLKEKKAWIKWMEVDVEAETEKELNHEIHHHCRLLQSPFQGKSFIHEEDFYLEQVWPQGKNEFVDWFYKGITPFYYAMQELSRIEKDPFKIHVLEIIKAGKFILKKEPEKFRSKDKYKLVGTVEGNTPQLRKILYGWEEEKKNSRNNLFWSNT
ncbi:MAG: hypothetical protein K8R21_03460 [Leptospira sp.]|nr:hypothetical protein [Leptospira sp.]